MAKKRHKKLKPHYKPMKILRPRTEAEHAQVMADVLTGVTATGIDRPERSLLKNPDTKNRAETEMQIRVEAVHKSIPSTALRFTAIVNDRFGLDAVPCSLLFRLNSLYFADCTVAVTNLTTKEKGILGDVFSLMMLVASAENILEFKCSATSEMFDRLRRCAFLLYRVNEVWHSSSEYDECSWVLEEHRRDGNLKLEEALVGAMEAGGRTPMLRDSDASC